MQIKFPSKWVKADDIGDEMNVTIEKVGFDESDDKGISYWIKFKEFSDKKWTMNITNFKTISKVLESEDSDDWIGHQITLYTTEVTFGGETMLGVRVRLRKPGATSAGLPSGAGVLGAAGETRLLSKIEALAKEDASITLDSLRTSLAGKNPQHEAVIAGDPRAWPITLGQQIADWLEEQSVPF